MNKDVVWDKERVSFLEETVRVLVENQSKLSDKVDALERKHENNLKDWSMVKELKGDH